MDTEKLLNCLVGSLRAQARKLTYDRHMQDDLFQEGVLAALQVVDRYKKPFEELVLLAGRSARNRMITCLRKRRLSYETLLPDEQLTNEPDTEYQELLNALRKTLTPRALKVLEHDLIDHRTTSVSLGVPKWTLFRTRSEIRQRATELGLGQPEEPRRATGKARPAPDSQGPGRRRPQAKPLQHWSRSGLQAQPQEH